MSASVGGRLAIERGRDFWRTERRGSAGVYILAAVTVLPMLGFGLREGWLWLARERPEPRVEAILERAAAAGVFAVDGVSGAQSLRPLELPSGEYLLTTTARHEDAAPKVMAFLPSGQDCAALARELAGMKGELGFCERM